MPRSQFIHDETLKVNSYSNFGYTSRTHDSIGGQKMLYEFLSRAMALSEWKTLQVIAGVERKKALRLSMNSA